MKIDYAKVKEEAHQELEKEAIAAAKDKIKSQMKRVNDARQIYENEQRRLDDLYAQIEQGIDLPKSNG